MKYVTTIAAAAAIAAAGIAPALAQETKVNSDPFVSTQGEGSILTIGGVQYVVIAVTATAFIVALADGSSSSTTAVPIP